jgi:hypothetical protein
VSAVLENVAIGLVTSVVSGVCVWLWQRAKVARRLRREASFFGIAPGGECLLVLNHHPRAQWTMSHHDIQALVEVAMLVRELGAHASVKSWDEIRGGIGDRTEFCIGGPDANGRTRSHLLSHVQGVSVQPQSARRDPLALVVGDQRFRRDPGQREFAAVAKFTRPGAPHPVFVICGQTSVTNWAAVDFLKRNHGTLARTLASTDRFCIILRVTAPAVYGHQMVELEADVSTVAFTAPKQRSGSRGGAG